MTAPAEALAGAVTFEWVRSPAGPDRWVLWISVGGDRVSVSVMGEPAALAIHRALDTGAYSISGAVA